MEGQINLRPDLEKLIDQFVNYRKAYSDLKAQNAAQEELLRIQKTEVEVSRAIAETQRIRMKNLLTIIATKKQKDSILLKVQEENKHLVNSIEELQRDYDNLRSSSNEYAEQIRRDSENQICKLEEELEVARAQLALQEERHQEEIKLQEQKHRENINSYVLEYKSKLPIADNKVHQLAECKENTKIQHSKKTNGGNKKNNASLFRWPDLDISRSKKNSSSKQRTTVSRTPRKKKLYSLDNETIVDIV